MYNWDLSITTRGTCQYYFRKSLSLDGNSLVFHCEISQKCLYYYMYF
jgi:hypothetical protein